jgi:GDPmannose 4,6-dehydratase
MLQKLAIVTGTGMDSKTITHLLLSKNYHVVLTYRRNTKQILEEISALFSADLIKYSESKLSFQFMDITDASSVRNGIREIVKNHGQPVELYSLAAQSHVGDSFKNETYTLFATGVSVFYLLDACREFCSNVKFFQASTSEMFGGDPKNCPFNEDSPLEFRSPYSIAKSLAYNWIKYFRQTYGMFCVTAFTFNHSNVYRHSSFFARKCSSYAAKIALGKADKIVCGNIDHWRDETYADFCVEGMWRLLQLESPEDIVLSSDICYHGEQFLDYSFGCFNLDWREYIKIDDSLKRPNEVVKLVGSSKKAQKLINWNPQRMPFKKHMEIMAQYDYELESGQVPVRPNVFDLYP